MQPVGEAAAAECDLIVDILRRVRELLPENVASSDALVRIEAQIRRDWGGERPYIAKLGDPVQRRQWERSRDRQIRVDYRRGEHVHLLARRYGISESRVYKIISG